MLLSFLSKSGGSCVPETFKYYLSHRCREFPVKVLTQRYIVCFYSKLHLLSSWFASFTLAIVSFTTCWVLETRQLRLIVGVNTLVTAILNYCLQNLKCLVLRKIILDFWSTVLELPLDVFGSTVLYHAFNDRIEHILSGSGECLSISASSNLDDWWMQWMSQKRGIALMPYKWSEHVPLLLSSSPSNALTF